MKYIWKMLKNLVLNFVIESYTDNRTGRHCIGLNMTIRIQDHILQQLEVQGSIDLQNPL